MDLGYTATPVRNSETLPNKVLKAITSDLVNLPNGTVVRGIKKYNDNYSTGCKQTQTSSPLVEYLLNQ